jgi:hypothetical protein
MALKDTLSKLQEQDRRTQQAFNDRRKMLEEWQQAVGALLDELRGHLAEYENDGVLTLSPDTIRLTEDGLGAYEVPVLKIGAGSAVILVQPLGRLIDATSGRIDMHCQGRVAGSQRVTLLRMPPSSNGSTLMWHIRMPQEARSALLRLLPRIRTVPLSKATLEQAIDHLLN